MCLPRSLPAASLLWHGTTGWSLFIAQTTMRGNFPRGAAILANLLVWAALVPAVEAFGVALFVALVAGGVADHGRCGLQGDGNLQEALRRRT